MRRRGRDALSGTVAVWRARRVAAVALLRPLGASEPSPAGSAHERVRNQQRALGWSAIAAVAIAWWIVRSVAVGVLLGTLAAFILQPLYERAKPRVGARWAAIAVVLGTMLTVVAVVALLAWAFVVKGVGLAHDLFDDFVVAGATHRLTAIVGGVTKRFGFGPEELEARLRTAGEEVASRVAGVGADVASASAAGLLAVFMGLLTMHFILLNWQTVSARLEASLPLRRDYSHALFEEFRRSGRATLLGTIVTGLAQGLLATLGYAVCGVPRPLFFGVATALASLIPAVGTMLVWMPVGVVLLFAGRTAGGVGVLVWGGCVIVALSDYVIRPRLLAGEAETPALITFASLFGGVEAFGLKGLIIGPVLISLAIAVLRIYAREAEEMRRTEPARDAGPP
jgi:predicted PurR-regulated permease PerM